MPSSRKVEKRIKESGGRNLLAPFVFPAKNIGFWREGELVRALHFSHIFSLKA